MTTEGPFCQQLITTETMPLLPFPSYSIVLPQTPTWADTNCQPQTTSSKGLGRFPVYLFHSLYYSDTRAVHPSTATEQIPVQVTPNTVTEHQGRLPLQVVHGFRWSLRSSHLDLPLPQPSTAVRILANTPAKQTTKTDNTLWKSREEIETNQPTNKTKQTLSPNKPSTNPVIST